MNDHLFLLMNSLRSSTANDKDNKCVVSDLFKLELQFSSFDISAVTREQMTAQCPVFMQDSTIINEIAGVASEFLVCFSSQV